MRAASPRIHDVAVVGLGAAGAVTLRALAREGASVIGLDRWAPPHDRGSSHGETRMLRAAYGEGVGYTPLALRAIDLWRAAERDTGARLFDQTGLVYAGPQDSPFLAATRASGEAHGVALTPLTMAERSAAGFEVPDDWQCFLEPRAGFLHAEPAIEAFLGDAHAQGAQVRTDARCLAIEAGAEGVAITVEDDAAPIRARRCVVAAGGWTPELLPQLAPMLSVERRTIHWFANPTGRYRVEAGFRPFYIEDADGLGVYGLPDWNGGGVKIGEHTIGAAFDHPDAVDRSVHPADEARVAGLAARYFPQLGPIARSETCLYPMSREDFILDRLPGEPRIVVAAGLSGHGFKFAPVLGESAAALALGGAARRRKAWRCFLSRALAPDHPELERVAGGSSLAALADQLAGDGDGRLFGQGDVVLEQAAVELVVRIAILAREDIDQDLHLAVLDAGQLGGIDRGHGEVGYAACGGNLDAQAWGQGLLVLVGRVVDHAVEIHRDDDGLVGRGQGALGRGRGGDGNVEASCGRRSRRRRRGGGRDRHGGRRCGRGSLRRLGLTAGEGDDRSGGAEQQTVHRDIPKFPKDHSGAAIAPRIKNAVIPQPEPPLSR
jgi:monomeric sarcosine oxidase